MFLFILLRDFLLEINGIQTMGFSSMFWSRIIKNENSKIPVNDIVEHFVMRVKIPLHT